MTTTRRPLAQTLTRRLVVIALGIVALNVVAVGIH